MQAYMAFQITMLQALKRRSESNSKRLEGEIALVRRFP